jgi:hypothetical protein
MTRDIDTIIRRAILFVADEAWGIAFEGQASSDVCLAIEALSDDPTECERLMAAIKSDLK